MPYDVSVKDWKHAFCPVRCNLQYTIFFPVCSCRDGLLYDNGLRLKHLHLLCRIFLLPENFRLLRATVQSDSAVPFPIQEDRFFHKWKLTFWRRGILHSHEACPQSAPCRNLRRTPKQAPQPYRQRSAYVHNVLPEVLSPSLFLVSSNPPFLFREFSYLFPRSPRIFLE